MSLHSNTSAWVMSSADQCMVTSSATVTEVDVDEEREYYSDTESCHSDASYDSALFYEREGVMVRHSESSYIHPRTTSNQTKGIRYDLWTPKELKRFVRDRMLPDPYPKDVTLKYYYLRILQRAGKTVRFDFLDLPPELRLMVFRKLLLFKTPDEQILSGRIGSVYPQILQTCKLIHEEANDVLYDENTFVADARSCTGKYTHGVCEYVRFHEAHSCLLQDVFKFVRIPEGIDDYPSFLRRISRLHVRLEYKPSHVGSPNVTQMAPLNHFFYTLASFLMEGHRLKHLHLQFDLGADVNASHYRMICYPLRRLRNIEDLTTSGGVPDGVEKALVAAFERPGAAFNTMRHWRVLFDEAHTHMELHTEMRDHCGCDCSDFDCLDCMDRIEWWVFDLDEVRAQGCFSSSREKETVACLGRLSHALNEANVKKVKEVVLKNGQAEERSTRLRYRQHQG